MIKMRQKRREQVERMGGDVYNFMQSGHADIVREKWPKRVNHANSRVRAEGGKFKR